MPERLDPGPDVHVWDQYWHEWLVQEGGDFRFVGDHPLAYDEAVRPGRYLKRAVAVAEDLPAAQALIALQNYDQETAHMVADEILLREIRIHVPGGEDIARAFLRLSRWYS